MSFDLGINFRATAVFVTDGANQTYIQQESFPVTRAGITVSLQSGTLGDYTRNRQAGYDPRLAGLHFAANTGTAQLTYRFTLPATGDYDIYSAHGDSDNPQVQYIQFLDNGTLLATPFAGTATATNQFGDAMGTVHASHTAWIANNAPRRLTFSTTNFDIRFGSSTAGSSNSILNHVRIVQVASATPSGPNILLNNRGNSQIQLTPLGVGNSIMIIR